MTTWLTSPALEAANPVPFHFLGLRLTWWSIDSRDWTGLAADEMAAAIRPRLRDGTILLMHDGIGPGTGREGAEETVRLIERLSSDGVGWRIF